MSFDDTQDFPTTRYIVSICADAVVKSVCQLATMTTMSEEDVDDMKSELMSSEVSVRRCLFERPDVDTMRQDLERAWTELQLSSSVMWNFDFDRQRPFAGPIVWTRVGDVWLGKISADSEKQRESIASSVTSSTRRDVRDHTRRYALHHTARVIRSSRSTQRRQSRVTGGYCCRVISPTVYCCMPELSRPRAFIVSYRIVSCRQTKSSLSFLRPCSAVLNNI